MNSRQISCSKRGQILRAGLAIVTGWEKDRHGQQVIRKQLTGAIQAAPLSRIAKPFTLQLRYAERSGVCLY